MIVDVIMPKLGESITENEMTESSSAGGSADKGSAGRGFEINSEERADRRVTETTLTNVPGRSSAKGDGRKLEAHSHATTNL